MSVIALHGGKAITMTSLELVDFINSQRGEGEAELRHRDFTAKVPKVIGEGVCEIFRTPHTNPQNGQTYFIYAFPKRPPSFPPRWPVQGWSDNPMLFPPCSAIGLPGRRAFLSGGELNEPAIDRPSREGHARVRCRS